MFKEIIYKLFNLEEFPCNSCETLKTQLALKNEENAKLLNTILEMNKPKSEIQAEIKEIKPIQPKNIPWSVRRQMIETEDRRAAQILAEKLRENQNKPVDPEIEKLEKELAINE